MGLFKNEVGRPSNETLKKRRMFYILVAVLAVLIIGGGGYFTYTKLKPKKVESTGKDATLLKFKTQELDDYCFNIEAPAFAKNWRVQVYGKKSGASSYGNNKLVNYNHYNDGVRKQKICLSDPIFSPRYKGGKYTDYRILVKATTGANDKVNTKVNPNVWKPSGWSYNKSIGWAYKDVVFESGRGDGGYEKKYVGHAGFGDAIINRIPYVTIEEPNKISYTKPTLLTFKVTTKGASLFKGWDNWPIWYKVETDIMKLDSKNNIVYERVSESKCIEIRPGEVKKFYVNLTKPNETYISSIAKYSDNKCESNRTIIDQTNGYRYTK